MTGTCDGVALAAAIIAALLLVVTNMATLALLAVVTGERKVGGR